jgi:hypothetical protein
MRLIALLVTILAVVARTAAPAEGSAGLYLLAYSGPQADSG